MCWFGLAALQRAAGAAAEGPLPGAGLAGDALGKCADELAERALHGLVSGGGDGHGGLTELAPDELRATDDAVGDDLARCDTSSGEREVLDPAVALLFLVHLLLFGVLQFLPPVLGYRNNPDGRPVAPFVTFPIAKPSAQLPTVNAISFTTEQLLVVGSRSLGCSADSTVPPRSGWDFSYSKKSSLVKLSF